MFVVLTARIRRALGWGVAVFAAAECDFVHKHPVTKPRPILLLHLSRSRVLQHRRSAGKETVASVTMR